MSLKCIHVFSYEFGHSSQRLGVTLGFSLSVGAVKRASTFAHRCNADREEGGGKGGSGVWGHDTSTKQVRFQKAGKTSLIRNITVHPRTFAVPLSLSTACAARRCERLHCMSISLDGSWRTLPVHRIFKATVVPSGPS